MSAPAPAFSVIMPSYRHGEYVSDAIASVLDQTCTDLELVVVDDASDDGTSDVLASLEGSDARIRVLRHPRRMGIARTLNDGLEAARGRWVAFLASDDLWLPEMLEQQARVLGGGAPHVAWTDARLFHGERVEMGLLTTALGVEDAQEDMLLGLCQRNFICLSAVALELELARELAFEESLVYLNDHLFLLELASRRRFERSGPARLLYRRHATNCTKLEDADAWAADARALRVIAERRLGAAAGADALEALAVHLRELEVGAFGAPPSSTRP